MMNTAYRSKRLSFTTWSGERDKEMNDRADKFIRDILRLFYNFLKENGLERPKELPDKYRNPNPLMFYKVYSDEEILLVHYMINEGLLDVVIKLKQPLLIKGSISQKGLDYLFLEDLLKI